jgi:hypothetical protein
MDFEKWRPWYERIVTTFGFDRTADERSADLLERLIQGKAIGVSFLRKLVQGETVVVFGCGPSVERNINEFITAPVRDGSIVLAADGASTPLVTIGHIVPRIVVTDFDGGVEDIVSASRGGSLVVVHAHGDNMSALKTHVPKFMSMLGSTQVEPRPNVNNFGGFTDGDRSAFLAEEAGAKRVILLGMDFGRVVGKYSKPGHMIDYPAGPVKIRKLRLAKELLTWLASWASTEILNATGSREKIPGVQSVALGDL